MLELLRKYRIPIVVVGSLLGALLFYSLMLRHRGEPTALETRTLSVLSPLQQGASRLLDGLAAAGERIFGAGGGETARLRDENRRLRAQLTALEEDRLEVERLRRLLDFGAHLDAPTVAARVIADDASTWFRTVVIDRGAENGLKEGMAVINDQGVVGRIISASPRSARVMLAVDTASRISALDERSRSRGIARGDGEGLSFDYVPMTADVKVGDILVTSGLGGGFPKGLVVGVATEVTRSGFDMFQTIRVAPAVDFDRLEEVLVVVPAGRALPTLPAPHGAAGRP